MPPYTNASNVRQHNMHRLVQLHLHSNCVYFLIAVVNTSKYRLHGNMMAYD